MRGRFYGLVECLIKHQTPLPGCIGCEQTAAKRDGRPKNASTDTGLSDVDISYDQSSRWQKLAAVPEEIFERQVQDKSHMPTTSGLIRAAAERGHAGAPDHSDRRFRHQRSRAREMAELYPSISKHSTPVAQGRELAQRTRASAREF